MLSGVVVVELKRSKFSPTHQTFRILVRNAENLHEACIRAATRAFELAAGDRRGLYASCTDFIRCDFDAIS